MARLPGWEVHSYGYHGDDGNAFSGSGRGREYGPEFAAGDVIGALLDRAARTITFFKNGEDLGVAFTDVSEEHLYPTVGMRTAHEEVRANFGAAPFAVDLASLQAEFAGRVLSSVQDTVLPCTAPAVGSAKQPALLPSVVFDYLLHHRYWQTAAVVARDMLGDGQVDPGAAVAVASNGDATAMDASPSKVIKAEEAVDMTDDGDQEADTAAVASSSTGSKADVLGVGSSSSILTQSQVNDAVVRQSIYDNLCTGNMGAALALIAEQYGHHVLSEFPRLHFKLKVQQFVELLRGGGEGVTAALAYGRSELGPCDKTPDDEELLSDALSLLAYAAPEASPYGHLLRPSQRVELAEELNGALLQATGLSAQPTLDRIYRQAVLAVDELKRSGHPKAAVVDVCKVCFSGLKDSSDGGVAVKRLAGEGMGAQAMSL